MSNREQIKPRAIQAAEKALHHQHFVSAIDVFVGMGLLQPIHVQDWRKGKIQYLESVIQGSLGKISHAMKCFQNWAKQRGLKASKTCYLARTSGPKRELRFSKTGNPDIESAYQTHYVSPALSEKKQQKLKEKADQPPELVVFWTISNAQCSRCEEKLPRGNFLLMEAGQPLCLACTPLNGLVFVPRGNMKLTLRSKKYSTTSAVVVKFSRARKRYERQGILVQEAALQKAEKEIMEQR